MPLKIGDTLVIAHRGSLLGKIVDQKKDSQYASVLGLPNSPAPKHTGLGPRIKLESALAPENQYHSPKAVRNAANAQMTFLSANALQQAVGNHIRTRLASAATQAQRDGTAPKPVMIVVGENHATKASLMVNIAAMGAVFDPNRAPPVLMVEMDADMLAGYGPQIAAIANGVTNANTHPAPQASAYIASLIEAADPRVALQAAKIHVAQSANFDVLPFDTLHGMSRNLEQREASMIATLSNALVQANGAPVIVSAGSVHVAALHAQFAPHTSMAVIASMEGSTGKTPYERKADSYLLAHPDIMKFTSSPALEGPAAPLNFMQFGFDTGL